MDELEQELKICFLDEANQLIEDVEQSFLALENNREDLAIIEKIFRLAHNLKGSSRAVGFVQMAEFTHVFESLLLKIKNKETPVDSAAVSLMLRCVDHLRNWVAELKGNLDASMNSDELVVELQARISGQGVAAPEAHETPTPAAEVAAPEIPSSDAAAWNGVPPADAFNQVEAQPAATPEMPAEAVPSANQFVDPAADAALLAEAEAMMAANAPAPQAAAPTPPPPPPPAPVAAKPAPAPVAAPASAAKPDAPKAAAAAEDESVRVSLKRLESLVNFVGELVILQTVLNQQRHLIDNPLLTRTISQLAKITKDIQDLSMSLRMVPLKQTFQKMQRIVRDTSKALKKEINFTISGEQTEIDKTVVEQLGDPLVHLVRNAVDHGVESAEERIAAGKSPVGNISLEAFHKGGQIVIEVKDDGKGLNAEKLKSIAIQKGIIKPDAVLTTEECWKLIFAAGFSTKTEVTEVSGRGVGMDVVRTNIEKNLHGEIQLYSEIGKGSTMRIILPLTLAIIDGMVVRSAEERYVVPLGHVHESLQPSPEDVHTVTGLGEVLSLRGEELPLIRLSTMLGRSKGVPKKASECIAIVVRASEKPFSVLVDDIIGQQQIVIKQLGAEIRSLKGVSGSAILGDGRAALILDLTELANRGSSKRANA